MGIRISQIDAKNIGPLKEFSMTPGDLNLVYGHNEHGKTGLVEFLLTSLFKKGNSNGSWKLRGLGGNGKVTVEGIPECNEAVFRKTGEKLEDLLIEKREDIPENLSRLLVVRGGNTALADNFPAGASKDIISRLLSNEDLLKKIQDAIPANINRAEITAESIEGDKRGEIKDYNNLKNDIENIEDLFQEAEEARLSSNLSDLINKKEDLEKEIGQQEKAKRYYAYQLKREKESLEKQLAKLPEDQISDMLTKLNTFNNSKKELKRKQDDLKQLAEGHDNYNWLKHSKDLYNKYINLEHDLPGKGLIIGALIAIIISAVLLFTPWPWAALIPILIAAGLAFSYIKKLKKSLSEGAGQNEELQRLKEEFESRFNTPLTGLPQMEQLNSDFLRNEGAITTLENEINRLKDEYNKVKDELSLGIKLLTDKEVAEEEWGKSIMDLQSKHADTENKIHELDTTLAGLNVPENMILTDDPGCKYDRTQMEELKSEFEDMQESIDKSKQSLQSVKEHIIQETKSYTSSSFEELLEKLTELKESKVEEYKDIAAKIIGGNTVAKVLSDLQQQEDQAILQGLESEEVSDAVNSLTGTYNKITMVEEQLHVSGPVDEWDFEELSTGVKEQVMLALRMGFSLKISHGSPMFLILDDAFQHSDYERRERLVKEVIKLVNKGWQIFYLTMDDHLRDLFTKHGRSLGKKFVSKNL